jgi:hypothetical protein
MKYNQKYYSWNLIDLKNFFSDVLTHTHIQEMQESSPIRPRAKFENRSIDYHDLNILPNAVNSHQFWPKSNKNNGHVRRRPTRVPSLFYLNIFLKQKKSFGKKL